MKLLASDWLADTWHWHFVCISSFMGQQSPRGEKPQINRNGFSNNEFYWSPLTDVSSKHSNPIMGLKSNMDTTRSTTTFMNMFLDNPRVSKTKRRFFCSQKLIDRLNQFGGTQPAQSCTLKSLRQNKNKELKNNFRRNILRDYFIQTIIWQEEKTYRLGSA